jgi:tRNA-dihydrouridine synthase B
MLDRPIDIAGLCLANRVWLAPMSGISDAVYRMLADRFGAGLVFSEMIASREMLRGSDLARRQSSFGGQRGVRAVQLAGNEPQVMADAARMCADRGAQLIDINFGCPAKKVTKGYAGSALMRDEALAADIMAAVCKAVDVPVSVKMRLGWDATSLNAPTIAAIAEDVGIAMVTVHGRTRAQMYKGRSDWRAVRSVVDSVGIPVVVNGDVLSRAAADEAIGQSTAAAVMVGRAATGAPWLPGEIAGAVAPLSMAGRWQVVLEHYEGLLSLYGRERGVRLARKHIAAYLDNLGVDAEDRRAINRLGSADEVLAGLRDLASRHLEQVAAAA